MFEGVTGKRKTAEINSRFVKSKYFWACVRKYPRVFVNPRKIVFDDAAVVYSLERLPMPDGKMFQLKPDDERNKTVTITFYEDSIFYFDIASESKDHRTRSTALANLLFTQRARYHPAEGEMADLQFTQKFTTVYGSMYYIPREPDDPKVFVSAGINAWLGANASVKICQDSSYALALGLVNRLFYELNMDLFTFYYEAAKEEGYNRTLEQFRAEARGAGMNEGQVARATRLLHGRLSGVRLKTSRALVSRNGRSELVERHGVFDGLYNCPAMRFQFPRGSRTTMEEVYYRLGCRLEYPGLPLCVMKQGNKSFYVPLELVHLPDKPQRYAKAIADKMRANFIRGVCRQPEVHRRFTEILMHMMEYNRDGARFINGFLFSTEPSLKMIECDGRVLPSPQAIDKERRFVEMTPQRAIKRKELNEAPIGKVVFAVIVMKGVALSEDRLRGFFNDLVEKCIQRGMTVKKEALEFFPNITPTQEHVEERVVEAKNRFEAYSDESTDKVLMILVFNNKNYWHGSTGSDERLFDRGSTYGLIKSICDVKYGIASQVIDQATLSKGTSGKDKTIFYNIALKINAKLGGVNQAVIFDEQSGSAEVSEKDAVMYVGIDVTHPTNNSGIDISIASMVANVDLAATRYTSEILAQMKARETVERFETQFSRMMLKFHEHSKVWPRHVVILRDGVSDSEMFRTAFIELKYIRDSWKRITHDDETLEPTYTYIVLQKRHVTRFYVPAKDSKGNDTFVNVPSGTVVDQVISSPRIFDFYLASQFGALGTTRPTHYTVVYDDWMLNPDKIYEMCYRLCFIYARCRIPVSLPCPVYYAHLVCEKMKEVYKTHGSEFDAYTEESEKKDVIEKYLTVPEHYPGMHFV